MTPSRPTQDWLLRVRGTVQGVGFRPFVARLATDIGLTGWVRNDAEGVLVRAVGSSNQLDLFAEAIAKEAPAAAVVDSVDRIAPPPDTPGVNGTFTIVESTVPAGAVETNAPVDLAPCPQCRRELAASGDRRHGYAFINCTQCGPRYSIIESLPYDRPRTTMRCFPMCPECRREYGDPRDRRFHAEPNACPVCGPELQLATASGTPLAQGPHALAMVAGALLNGGIVAVKGVGGFHLMVDAQNESAVAELRRRKHREQKPFAVMFADLAMLREWAVVSADAAVRLESPQAPIVLVPKRDVAAGAKREQHTRNNAVGVAAEVTRLEVAVPPRPSLVTSAATPNGIVPTDCATPDSQVVANVPVGDPSVALGDSVGRDANAHLIADVPVGNRSSAIRDCSIPSSARAASALAPSVAPGNPWIGALLPSSPIHLELMAAVKRPLVATSGNLSDEPLCTDDHEARVRLAGIADLFLGHNRPIARPIDDSVIRFTGAGASILLRRARGFAPTPLALPAAFSLPLICVGAQMKNTVAVASGRRVILSPHIGDLDGAATHGVFTRTIETLAGLFETKPVCVVCDRHPDYASTRWAQRSGLPCITVQHHLAHVLAVMLEHRQPANDVLGVAWDGTGYGEDGTIWGGEFFRVREGRALRFARLRPFQLPGGDAAVRDPRRVAFSLGWTAGLSGGRSLAQRLGIAACDATTLGTMLSRGLNAPLCSSIGRLFDAFGALLGISAHNAFEGQTPLAVEIAATSLLGGAAKAPKAMEGAASLAAISAGIGDDHSLPFPIVPASDGALWEIDWQPAFEAVLAGGRSPNEFALALHRGLSHAIAEVAALAGMSNVVLSGGCFQNALLRDLVADELVSYRFRVLAARDLPPNDGAIAAGQALAALWNLTTVELPATP